MGRYEYKYKRIKEQYKIPFPALYDFLEWLETETRKGAGIQSSWATNIHLYAKDCYFGRIELKETGKEVCLLKKYHSQIKRGTKDCSHLLFPEPIMSTVQRYPNFHGWAKIDKYNNTLTIKNNAPSSVFKDLKELIRGINEGRKVKLNNVQAEQILEPEPIPEEILYPEKYYEGIGIKITVNRYERNPKARKKCIEHYGVECLVCGFNFEKAYGKIGEGYIEVHHVKPLSEIRKGYEVHPIMDLRPVCPNCHAMLHQDDLILDIDDLRRLMLGNN